MAPSTIAGYVVIVIAGVMLASHGSAWRDLQRAPDEGGPGRDFARRTLLRRTFASGLMALIGVAIALKPAVPVDRGVVSAYLAGLLLAVAALFALGVADWRAQRDRQHRLSLTQLQQQLDDHLMQQRDKLAVKNAAKAQKANADLAGRHENEASSP